MTTTIDALRPGDTFRLVLWNSRPAPMALTVKDIRRNGLQIDISTTDGKVYHSVASKRRGFQKCQIVRQP